MPNAKTLERPDRATLEELRQSLDTQRAEMFKLYKHDVRVGQDTTDDNSDDFADRANNSYNRELMFTLSGSEREALIRIDEAIGRLAKGSYGLCVHCDRPISVPRLQAVPWARFCIGCQELDEKGMLED
ncbi:MAG: TraR/DksA C4-type zinc finger protein [Thermoanaerobaculia bacterium]